MAKNTTVAKVENTGGLPSYLSEQTGNYQFGNIDQSDLIIPRIKLLQALSPEIQDFETARPGNFWHSVASEMLGKELRIIPILLRKSFVLWAPRGDDRGILARANDGVHWDPPNMEFRVRPKGSPGEVVWKTAETVDKSGLAEFGTSIPGDPKSPPAASLTYNILVLVAGKTEMGPALLLNTRSAVRPAKDLISKVTARRNVPSFAQVYRMVVKEDKGPQGPFFNYGYASDGFATEEEFRLGKDIFDNYQDKTFRASDEDDEESSGAPKADSSKF